MQRLDVAKIIRTQVQKRVDEGNADTKAALVRYQNGMFSSVADVIQHIKNKFLVYLNKDSLLLRLDLPALKLITKDYLNYYKNSNLTFADIEKFFNDKFDEFDLPCYASSEETAEHYLMKILLNKVKTFSDFVNFLKYLMTTDLKPFAERFLQNIHLQITELNISNYIAVIILKKFQKQNVENYFDGINDNNFTACVCFTTLCDIIKRTQTITSNESEKIDKLILQYRDMVMMDDFYDFRSQPKTETLIFQFTKLRLTETLNSVAKSLNKLCARYVMLEEAYKENFSCVFTSYLVNHVNLPPTEIEDILKNNVDELLASYLSNKQIRKVSPVITPLPVSLEPNRSEKEEKVSAPKSFRRGDVEE